mmetsp:Transcript_881/g.2465  ORF Transcript_881/g.2465 Transcript_881/m.2465 type:complete len:162 (-) Transcript_881:77-562(-)
MEPSTDAEQFACTHGGPGEIEASKKAVFVETCNATMGKVHKALLFRAPRQEIIAAEMIAVEEMISNSDGIQSMVDESLMRLYFGLAVSDLLKAKVEDSRVNARVGLYIAMYVQKGNFDFIDDVNFRTALGQVETDSGLAKFLNVQTKCGCLEQALPSLKGG